MTVALKQELGGTKAYEQTSAEEKSVINHHSFQNATGFDVSVDEDNERLPKFVWLHKLHKQPYKARFIANSSSCTTAKLSKLLASCRTTIKNHINMKIGTAYGRARRSLQCCPQLQSIGIELYFIFHVAHERRCGRVVRAVLLWRRKSPYRVSSRLDLAMRRLENSSTQQKMGTLFELGKNKAAKGE